METVISTGGSTAPLPGPASAMPAPGLPVSVIRFHGREMVVGKAHQVEPLFGPGVASLLARVFPDPGGQPVCFPVNTLQDPARDLVRLQRLHAEAQTVYVADAPHFQAVRHILYGALHAAAGSGGNGHSLLPAHFRQRPVDHPPCPEVIQKAHHLPRGVIHIYGAGQNQQIGFPYCGGKRLQLLIMRAVGQIGLETGIAAKAGLVEIPGQENSRTSPPTFCASSLAIMQVFPSWLCP